MGEIDDAFREFQRKQRELDELLNPPWVKEKEAKEKAQRLQSEIEQLKKQIDELRSPSKPRKKAGRPPKFTLEQVGLLQAEYRRYRRENEDGSQKDAIVHLQGWARKRFKIIAGPRTIRDQVIKPVDDEMKELQK